MTIKIFDLACPLGHTFEGWFESAEAFEDQKARGLLECPQCGSRDIVRRPAASRLAAKSQSTAAENKKAAEQLEMLMAHVRESAQAAEDVGERFASEARAIKRGDAPERAIRGTCTRVQAEELLEEGIPVLPVPESVGKTLN